MLCFLFCCCLLFLHPNPSYFQSPESNQDNTNNDEDDDANSTTSMTSVNSKDSDNTINDTMAKSSKSMASAATKKSTQKPNNKKTTGMEAIDLDTPPRKKPRATATASHYSINTMQGFTVNPYAKGSKNKINIILHKGSVPLNDAQPHVTLLPGGMMLSIQWKAPKKLYTEL
jgi:hypothetical protein